MLAFAKLTSCGTVAHGELTGVDYLDACTLQAATLQLAFTSYGAVARCELTGAGYVNRCGDARAAFWHIQSQLLNFDGADQL